MKNTYRIVKRIYYRGNIEFIVQRYVPFWEMPIHLAIGWKDESYFYDEGRIGVFKTLKEAQKYIELERGTRDEIIQS